MSMLFTPVRIGGLSLSNRMVMAPMTRSRADDAGVPDDDVVTYYAQRSSAGLIITEGVFPSASGKGYVRTPGIHGDAQVVKWKRVTAAVHARGGHVFMQLMHSGRISHPSLQPHGALPVAPSAIKPAGQTWTGNGMEEFVTPRALRLEEIAGVVHEYRMATRRALEAGCDGVELHAASGYLPEQFLSSGSNHRTDEYGGSIANRARFVLEVLDAMVAEAGGDRVGIKISPEMNFNDISDATPQETYTHLVEQLRSRNLAYLHVALFNTSVDYHALLRPRFEGAYLVGGGLDQGKAESMLAAGHADATVFGSAFLANPDLPERFRVGAALNLPDKNTFYTPGAQGYIDYPMLDRAGED
ncbi:alkene reductase [Burkholderia cenocepacia]|uniref:alkene reductase n=2 Tax=Burkholderia cenocepacia TaxID=95486 RepID=UPI00073A5B3A|nr:alkene reductase [Burkholderia cenocepacia]ALV60197.1 1,2-oxophytodienoate reductase [Burkholderia cenocepacia]AQQ23178.1 alkene reductase [Burkholderia cenocepacia]AQQ47110.1 alkene reductase [Burkholderia cenocepacia]MBR8261748.1 alkene reductase [Burkholderia cenocepacia]MCW3539187.1 alkene reductase [Burkholderia cenocepacia]